MIMKFRGAAENRQKVKVGKTTITWLLMPCSFLQNQGKTATSLTLYVATQVRTCCK